MTIDDKNNKHLIADEGKVLKRISDGWIAGREIYLGVAFYMYGAKLKKPIQELPEHYTEVDEGDDITVITPEEPIEATQEEIEKLPEEEKTNEDNLKVTYSDYKKLEEKVNEMYNKFNN